ncbi:MAG TPA: hypothetical protein PKG69_03740 [Methanoregulaceae archaeon]|nr:hypothetical protein [Methanoregulaceae archaeon]
MNSRLLAPILLSLAFPLVLVVLLHSRIPPGSLPYVMASIALILLFPLLPLLYGFFTGDPRGAVITGIIPLMVFAVLAAALGPPDVLTSGRIGQLLVFFVPLVLLGGLIGYCASRQKISWLILAACCGVVWLMYFIRAGFN